MPIDLQYIFLGVIFICAVLLVEGVYYLIQDTTSGRLAVNRRMKMLSAGTSPREVYEILRRKTNENYGRFGPFEKIARSIDRTLSQAGVTLTLTRAFILMGACSVLFVIGLFWLISRVGTLPPIIGSPFFSILVGVAFLEYWIASAGVSAYGIKTHAKLRRTIAGCSGHYGAKLASRPSGRHCSGTGDQGNARSHGDRIRYCRG